METLLYSTLDTHTPVGVVTIGVSAKGLAWLAFGGGRLPKGREAKHWNNVEWVRSEKETAAAAKQLTEYLQAKRKSFDLPLDLRGADFHQKCWRELLRIPFGKTKSYADIAREVGSPQAFRAVGQANHHNPVAIVVPCHRVLASGAKLGGYGGGLPMKEFLLRLEGAAFESPRLFE